MAAAKGGSFPTFDDLSGFEPLYRAHCLARRGKRNQREVIEFELDLARNLTSLSDSLHDGSYRPWPFMRFTVRDPKRRVIHTPRYRDRVVQHALCDNVLAPVLERRLIYDNAACRVGKGTHFSLDRLEGFMRKHARTHGTRGWFLKCDVARFFDSIRHDALKERLARLPLDTRTIDLLHPFIDSHVVAGSVVRGDERGLPLGCQSSQWFALYYLDGLDRLVKERLRVRAYTRYMDDMVLVHPDRAFLRDCLGEMRAFAADELGLEFNRKTQLAPLGQGIDYLGFHLYLASDGKVVRRLRQEAKRRICRRVKMLRGESARGACGAEELLERLCSYRAYLDHGDTYGLQKAMGFV